MKLTKTNFYLLLIFVSALILRTITAYNSHVSTIEMILSIIPLNIISAGRLGVIDQAPIYFYLTDLSYKLFGGVTPISLRFTSIIFGSLLVIAIFLVAKELFRNRKIGLLAAFLFAFSGFSITYNYTMDPLSFFLALFSLLFFIRFLREEQKNLYFSMLFLALSVMVNPYLVLLFPVYLTIWLIHSWRTKSWKLDKKTLILSLLLFVILISPILIYNYFTYTQLGISDVYFTAKLGLGETNYGGSASVPWNLEGMLLISQGMFKDIFKLDHLIIIFGLLGIILSLRRHKFANLVLIPSIFIYYLYMTGESGRSTYYIWIPLLFSIYTGYSLLYFNLKIKKWFKFKHLIPLVLILAVVLNIFVMQDIVSQREDSMTILLREYVRENIPEDAIVVVDPRIYRGINAWVFNDRHYVEGLQFFSLLDVAPTLPGEIKDVPLYYIECGPGTKCGWRAADFDRVYDRAEEISTSFHEVTEKVAEINAIDNIYIHKGVIELTTGIYDVIDQSHVFLYYPVGWKNPDLSADNYQVEGTFPKLLNSFGFLVLYLDVLLALLSIPYIFYLVFRKKKNSV